MAYKMKNFQEFQKYIDEYLEKYPIKINYKESLIENYNSSNLSDLYKLFLKLKGEELTPEAFNKLKKILNETYLIDDKTILENQEPNGDGYTISQKDIDSLCEIIKKQFLDYMSNPENTNIQSEEIYNLTVIMNKVYPNIFLTLITDPVADISKDQEIIKKRIMDTIDHWHQHNEPAAEEELRDILGGLYIITQKYHPDIHIYEPARIKSMRSANTNINKEVVNSLNSLIPSDLTRGLSTEDIDKQFNIKKANTDFSGITIVVGEIDDTMHLDKRDFRTKEIIKLRRIREESIKFSHSLENFLTKNEDKDFSYTELLQIKIELLMHLRLLTYDECTKEYNGTSFMNLLYQNLEEYKNKSNKDKFTTIEEMYELDIIYLLLDELKKRVHDKYQAKIAEIIIPEILQDELLTETLRLKIKFVKKSKKENGYCADYYEIETADEKKVELQVITRARFKESKDGYSDHSKLPNKEIPITQFFESSIEGYDKNDYDSLLELLKNTPVAKRNTLYLTADTELSPKDKRLKRRLKTAEQNIKLKETYTDKHTFTDGTVQETTYDLDTYLLNFAEYVSPKLMSVSSHHTRFNKAVAGFNKKSIVSAFTEVLLKQDYTSCLAQVLIDRLETIVPNDKNEISRNGIIRRSNKRYKQTEKNEDSKSGIEL